MNAITPREIKASDQEFEDYTISSVRRCKDGWDISTTDSTGIYLMDSRNPNGLEPRAGDKMRVYGRFGRPYYGIDLNGVEAFWWLPLEREADRASCRAKLDRESRERYALDRDNNERAIAELPAPLKERMLRFRAESSDFWRSESYELFACTQAAWLVDHLRSCVAEGLSAEDAVAAFRELSHQEQIAAGMSDQHSGNTFGGMCSLAKALLTGQPV